jgi:thioredoxin reductase
VDFQGDLQRALVIMSAVGIEEIGEPVPPGVLHRSPLLFETSLPGVFAVGDVRAGSVKRVAAAVGEGCVCIQLVHKVLAE